jgi:anti-sigma factor RsiW
MLPAFIKRELGSPEQTRIEAHLESCEDCRTELLLLKLMAEDAVPDPGGEFWTALPERVARAVQEQRPDRKPFLLSRWADRFLLPRWAWTAAAVGVVLLVSWFTINPSVRQEGHSPASSAEENYEWEQDPALSQTSSNLFELSPSELDTVESWAGRELSTIALEAESIMLSRPEEDISEELAELEAAEIERLSALLSEYEEEG